MMLVTLFKISCHLDRILLGKDIGSSGDGDQDPCVLNRWMRGHERSVVSVKFSSKKFTVML
jgi:hypothetical protein